MSAAEAAVVSVSHTHIYPGSRGRYADATPPPRDGAAVEVEFSDGVAARALLFSLPGDRRLLEVDEYMTAAGKRIPAKVWILERDGDDPGDDPLCFRVREHGEPAGPRRR